MAAAPYAREMAVEERDALRVADAFDRFDPIYKSMEQPSAPGRMPGESFATYRRRLLAGVQKFSSSDGFRRANLFDKALPETLVDSLETQIVADANAALADPSLGSFRSPGELRAVETRTDGGARVITYFGDPDAWMNSFKAPRQMVAAFPQDGRLGWR